MTAEELSSPEEAVGVSLVDGDADVRHARQIMLRSEKYRVRSYATCSALLADQRSRDYSCIILDVASNDTAGVDLLRRMRATGWRGKAILLEGGDPSGVLRGDAERHGDRVLERDASDHALLTAIEASVDRSWSGWNARG